jgi:superfamily II DNA/RNA helicase
MSEESVDFLDFKLNKQLWSAIADAGYETPTEIQAESHSN